MKRKDTTLSNPSTGRGLERKEHPMPHGHGNTLSDAEQARYINQRDLCALVIGAMPTFVTSYSASYWASHGAQLTKRLDTALKTGRIPIIQNAATITGGPASAGQMANLRAALVTAIPRDIMPASLFRMSLPSIVTAVLSVAPESDTGANPQ
jgi:hypothetical protein